MNLEITHSTPTFNAKLKKKLAKMEMEGRIVIPRFGNGQPFPGKIEMVDDPEVPGRKNPVFVVNESAVSAERQEIWRICGQKSALKKHKRTPWKSGDYARLEKHFGFIPLSLNEDLTRNKVEGKISAHRSQRGGEYRVVGRKSRGTENREFRIEKVLHPFSRVRYVEVDEPEVLGITEPNEAIEDIVSPSNFISPFEEANRADTIREQIDLRKAARREEELNHGEDILDEQEEN